VNLKLRDLEKKVQQEVEKIIDPETGLTFGQMKMIKNVKEKRPGILEIEFIPSSPFCPMAFRLALRLREAAENVEGVKKAYVYCRGHMMEESINEMVNRGLKNLDEG